MSEGSKQVYILKRLPNGGTAPVTHFVKSYTYYSVARSNCLQSNNFRINFQESFLEADITHNIKI